MIKYLGIELLEGISISGYDGENIFMCSKHYGKNATCFPIQFLNNLLQIIINNSTYYSEKVLCLQYSYYPEETISWSDPIELKLNDNCVITGILDNTDIIFNYDGIESTFPICWLNDDLKNKLNYHKLLQNKNSRREEALEKYNLEIKSFERNWFQKILDFIF